MIKAILQRYSFFLLINFIANTTLAEDTSQEKLDIIPDQNSSSLHINNFPQEMLVKCLQELSIPELCNAKLVCKHWYEMSKTPLLWRSKEVVLNSAPWQTETDEKALQRVYSLLDSHPVTRLHLADRFFKISGIREIIKKLTTYSSLTHLTLENISLSLDEGTTEIASLIQSNPSLKSLKLICCNIGNAGVKVLAKALKENKSLGALSLINNGITCESMTDLAKMIESNKTLRKLDLSNNGIENRGLSLLVTALKKNLSLLSLSLEKNHIKLQGTHEILMQLRDVYPLKKLYLEKNYIMDKKLQDLAASTRTQIIRFK